MTLLSQVFTAREIDFIRYVDPDAPDGLERDFREVVLLARHRGAAAALRALNATGGDGPVVRCKRCSRPHPRRAACAR